MPVATRGIVCTAKQISSCFVHQVTFLHKDKLQSVCTNIQHGRKPFHIVMVRLTYGSESCKLQKLRTNRDYIQQ